MSEFFRSRMNQCPRYSEEAETRTLAYSGRLNERDRRLYAAVDATKLGFGGVSYIAGLLRISRASIHKGIPELKALAKSSDDDPALPPRESAGRPLAKHRDSKLNQAFLDVVAVHTAGDPIKEEKQWMDLSVKETSERLKLGGHREAGEHVVKGLLKGNPSAANSAQRIGDGIRRCR